MIYVKINDNGIIENFETTVSDSIKYETVKFQFPLKWKEYSKTVVFRNNDSILNVVLDTENDLCISENECYIPYEVLKPPFFTISVFGVLGDSRVTSTKAEIKVIESGYAEGDKPSAPTPTEYEQLLNLANDTYIIAQSVRKDADNGVFNGENGKDAVCEQTYNPESENAQSGKAVAEAVGNKQDKIFENTMNGLMLQLNSSSANGLYLGLGNLGLSIFESGIGASVNDKMVNMLTGEPLYDISATPKSYVDGKIGDIETALDSIISIQNSLIGGENV